MAENVPDVDGIETKNPSDASADETADTGSPLDSGTYTEHLNISKRVKVFLTTHWRGVVAIVAPIIFVFILTPFPPEKYQYCAYCLVIMAVYWVSECIPLQVTSFLPVAIFPLTGVMDTRSTCKCYINDTILMFVGSIMLACAVEQSGLHKRLALNAIKCIGYSHHRMLFAVCFITMFISMWITNTAAATMMVPIVFALLRVYEGQGLVQIYEKNADGEQQATRLTSCYFCAITFAATIGGIGTLVGTATNLVFKGLFMKQYPTAEEYLSFPLFSAFAFPYMIIMNIFMYIYLLIVYMGLGRPNSNSVKQIKITPEGILAAKGAVEEELRSLGRITWHEIMVIVLFGGAILLFFCRSPQLFNGWGDAIVNAYDIKDKKYHDRRGLSCVSTFIINCEKTKSYLRNIVKDSAAAMIAVFLMILLPASIIIFRNCTAKDDEPLPEGTVDSVIIWRVMNDALPYSFIFLLGGGFALSTAAKPEYTDLNGKIGEFLSNLAALPNGVVLMAIIIFTVFVTNFASNVAVCNVIAPIAMNLAEQIKQNPLWYNIAAGFSSSYCFMIPVGTPGNLIVQSAANVPTSQMIIAGAGPTLTTIIISWIAIYLYAPVIWPDLNTLPEWAVKEN